MHSNNFRCFFDIRVSYVLKSVWKIGLIQYEKILEGVSIRHGAFTRERRLIQTYTLMGRLLDNRRLFDGGVN